MPLAPPIDLNPLDHNAECRYCDEQAFHAADCPWIGSLVAEVQQLRALITAKDEELLKATAKVEALRAPLQAVYDILLGGMTADYDEMTAALGRARAVLER